MTRVPSICAQPGCPDVATYRGRCREHQRPGSPSSTVTGTRRFAALSRRVIARDRGVCWLCGQAGADTADHVVPVAERPDLAYSLANLKAAHRSCNSARGWHTTPDGPGAEAAWGPDIPRYARGTLGLGGG